jgi:hypothetical protein
MKLIYNDQAHSYYLNGSRAKSVTAVAKIPTDQYAIQMWQQRMVAIGATTDPNLRENIARHIDNKQALNDLCEEAKKVAKAHLAADRGSQMHRVLELVLLDQEHKLLTEQQLRDADTLKRTLDRYKLTPYDYLTEQFVAWPEYTLTGRFDCVLERPDNSLWLVDLKSGPNAVTYPQTTCVQLALYARAPHISDHIRTNGDRSEVTDWRTMPERLDMRHGYVLLVEPDADIGTLHRLDIEHGWAAAQMALRIINWQKQLDRGKAIAEEVPEGYEPPSAPATWESLTEAAVTVDDLRLIWTRAGEGGWLTDELRALLTRRADTINGAA